MARARFFAAAPADAVGPGELRCVEVNGTKVLLARTPRGVFAISPVCTHAGLPMEEGVLSAGVLTCPHHGAQFDVASGGVRSGPAMRSLATFPAREKDGMIEVMVFTES